MVALWPSTNEPGGFGRQNKKVELHPEGTRGAWECLPSTYRVKFIIEKVPLAVSLAAMLEEQLEVRGQLGKRRRQETETRAAEMSGGHEGCLPLQRTQFGSQDPRDSSSSRGSDAFF